MALVKSLYPTQTHGANSLRAIVIILRGNILGGGCTRQNKSGIIIVVIILRGSLGKKMGPGLAGVDHELFTCPEGLFYFLIFTNSTTN